MKRFCEKVVKVWRVELKIGLTRTATLEWIRGLHLTYFFTGWVRWLKWVFDWWDWWDWWERMVWRVEMKESRMSLQSD